MDPNQPPTQQPLQTPPEVFDIQPKPNYLKTIIFSVLIVFTLGLIVYLFFQNQKLQKQVLNPPVSPTIQAPSPVSQSVSPTPKAVSSISVPTDETTEWKEYVSFKFGFTFKHPNFDDKCCGLAGAVSYNPELVVSLADKSTVVPNTDAPFDGIALYFIPNEDNLPLEQYIEKEKIALFDQFKIMADANQVHKGQVLKTSIAGQPAIALIDYSWDGITRTYLKHKNTKAIIEISKKEQSINHFKDYNQILSTFKFIDDRSVCVPTYQVETNSVELTAEQNYSVRCTEQRSEKDCFSIDLYNQKADDFSIPDGIPDCIWKNPINTI